MASIGRVSLKTWELVMEFNETFLLPHLYPLYMTDKLLLMHAYPCLVCLLHYACLPSLLHMHIIISESRLLHSRVDLWAIYK